MEDSRCVPGSGFRVPKRLVGVAALLETPEPGTRNRMSLYFLVTQCFTSTLFRNHEFSYLDRCDLARGTTSVPWSGLELSRHPRFCRAVRFRRAILCSMDRFREKKAKRCTDLLLVPEHIWWSIAWAIFRFSARSGWTCRSTFWDVRLRKKPQDHS